MKKLFITLLASAMMTASHAQFFGFGGQQIKTDDIGAKEKIADVNYADDNQPFHTLDIYLPKNDALAKQKGYPVMIHIYGSAWFSNNSKGMADLGTICKAYLEAGYAVVCPNHRSSNDAKWPAQSHDIKAVIRFVRANAAKYGFDTNFIGTSGFSSGGHLSSFMAATSGLKNGKVGNTEIDIEGNLGNNLSESSAINVAVSWSGPVCLESMNCAGTYPDKDKSPEANLIGKPCTADTQDLYLTISSTSFIDKNDPPMIGFHGTADNVVPYCQAETWYKMYQAAGAKCEFITVPEGGHGFNMYSEENLKKMIDFVNAAREAR